MRCTVFGAGDHLTSTCCYYLLEKWMARLYSSYADLSVEGRARGKGTESSPFLHEVHFASCAAIPTKPKLPLDFV